jgi:hypothetical protein
MTRVDISRLRDAQIDRLIGLGFYRLQRPELALHHCNDFTPRLGVLSRARLTQDG